MADHKSNVTAHLTDVNGTYHISMNWYVDGKRQRKSISTKLPVRGNKKRAEDMMKSVCAEQEELLSKQVSISSGGEIMLADYLEAWLETVRHELKPTTFGNYQSAITRTIAPYFRANKLTLIDTRPEDIQAFYAVQMARVKATTIHKYHNNLSKTFQYAIEQGIITHSPMDKVKRPRAERFAALFLRQSEAIALFEAVKGHKLELGVILAAYYGLRRGEIVGLRWESIDFEQNTITIDHTVTVAQVDGKKTVIESDTAKTMSSLRTLPLVPQFRDSLMALKNEKMHMQKQLGKFYNHKEGKYIYTDKLGNRIRPDYLTAEFPRFMLQHGFRRLRFHDLRHSCASLLLANGVPLKQIQDWLGHSSFKITADAYAHLEYASKLAAASAMTWINETSLGKADEEKVPNKKKTK